MNTQTNKNVTVEAVFYHESNNVLVTVDYNSGVIIYNGNTTKTKYPITSTKEFNRIKKQLAKVGVEYVGTSVF